MVEQYPFKVLVPGSSPGQPTLPKFPRAASARSSLVSTARRKLWLTLRRRRERNAPVKRYRKRASEIGTRPARLRRRSVGAPKLLLWQAAVLQALLPHAGLPRAGRFPEPRGAAELPGQGRAPAGAWARGRNGAGGSPDAVRDSPETVGGSVEGVSCSQERARGSGETVSCPQEAAGGSPGAVSGSRKTAGGSPEIISCALKMAIFAHPAADLLC